MAVPVELSAGTSLLIGLATPVLAFVGTCAANRVNRKGARELDTWRRREETMPLLRWAAEQAVSGRPTAMVMGVAALEELRDRSELLQSEDRPLIDAVVSATTPALTDDHATGDELEVVVASGQPSETAPDEEVWTARSVRVATPAQVAAAKLRTEMAEEKGETVPVGIQALANARPVSRREANEISAAAAS